MMKSKIRDSYQKTALETATPGRLIVMLMDGALKFLGIARVEIEGGMKKEHSLELINNQLVKAQNIVVELRASLDMKGGGEFAVRMEALYTYMEERIWDANVKKDKRPIEEVEKYLRRLRDAWAEVLRREEVGGVESAAVSCTA